MAGLRAGALLLLRARGRVLVGFGDHEGIRGRWRPSVVLQRQVNPEHSVMLLGVTRSRSTLSGRLIVALEMAVVDLHGEHLRGMRAFVVAARAGRAGR